MVPLFKEMAPLIIMQAKIWTALAVALNKVGSPLVKLMQVLEKSGLISSGKSGYDPNQSALNGAVRSHRVITSADELQRETASKALSAMSVDDQVKKATIDTPSKLDAIYNVLADLLRKYDLNTIMAAFKANMPSLANVSPVYTAGSEVASLIRSAFTR